MGCDGSSVAWSASFRAAALQDAFRSQILGMGQGNRKNSYRNMDFRASDVVCQTFSLWHTQQMGGASAAVMQMNLGRLQTDNTL